MTAGDGTADREAAVQARIEKFRRRRPRLTDSHVTTAHGAGGKASAALIDAVFLDAFANPVLRRMDDAAVVEIGGERVAITTDSYVVTPQRFPGGSIGDLAINGTVNDLAMVGAQPSWISAAFVLEEGLAVDELRGFVADMAAAASIAGVEIVAGDTKVVPRGAADRLFITTTGVGVVPQGRRLSHELVRPGDCVIVSGSIGDHGIAIMLARGDLAIEADVRSDTAALNGLVEVLMTAAPQTRWLRDPTRGGVASAVNELAVAAACGVVLDEAALPVRPEVRAACELLGIDPLYVANEGRLVAIVPPNQTGAALAAMSAHPLGRGAAVIGEVTSEPPGMVTMTTAFGGARIVDLLVGDPLPRIC